MRNSLFIGSVEYTKETVLLSLANLQALQTTALRKGLTVSELLNTIIHQSIGEDE